MISWSNRMIKDLSLIVDYFIRNQIGELLEKLANYFIYKHKHSLSFENYIMDFSENICQVSPGEYKLAFVCELANYYSNKTIQYYSFVDKKSKKQKIIFKNVYNWFSFMIKYCIIKLLKLENKMNFNEFFLTTLIKEKIMPEKNIKNKDDPIINITNFSYFLTRQLIEISKNQPDVIYKNSSLILETQNLDISICSSKQLREICNVLKTKRTLFARILLILSFEISKIDINDPLWLNKYIDFKNYDEFVSIISSPLVETLIFLTFSNI